MALVTLLHNPRAGDKGHTGERLVAMIAAAGYSCKHVSIKEENWQDLDANTKIIAVAGGDGTVRKAVKTLLEQELQHPITVLASGTANNVAVSLGISKDHAQEIARWKQHNLKQVDVGTIAGLGNEHFFLESFGYGLLPALMKEMKAADKTLLDTPKKELEMATRMLSELALTYQPHRCNLIVDGEDHTGEYILVEVLNMPYVGSNLNLAPKGNPGDGLFDIVLVTAEGREAFANFVREPETYPIDAACLYRLQGKQVQLEWDGKDAHVDDQLAEADGAFININIREKALKFLV